MRSSRFGVFAGLVAIGCASHAESAPAPPLEAPPPSASDGFDAPLAKPLATIRTCEDAALAQAYVGCEFWPTVVANNVWSVFDYAVVVANGGEDVADIVVQGNGTTRHESVGPGAVATIYLPWNVALKGPDADACGRAKALSASVLEKTGAYHLVSSRPVTVHQYNAIEYKGEGGPQGKDWSTCPGSSTLCDASNDAIGCLSFSNDAAILLPQTALTGTYRVTGIHGWSHPDKTGAMVHVNGAYVAVTATRDDTHVTVDARGTILAGKGVAATARGGRLSLTLNAGDVAELVGPPDRDEDLSGSLVLADKPVQLIAGAPCIEVPLGKDACDHLETSVLPAETWGRDYVVNVPTAARGDTVGHVVRLYGNTDDTHLRYAPSKPAGAPDVIHAGDVFDLGVITTNFRVTGDHELAVASLMLAGSVSDTVGHGLGDPSMSMLASTAQYRTDYVFLAPTDYDVSYVDIVVPFDAKVTLDGELLPASRLHEDTGFSVLRANLSRTSGSAHRLIADKPVGLQVVGYGAYTSYQLPGGMDLLPIAPPPVK